MLSMCTAALLCLGTCPKQGASNLVPTTTTFLCGMATTSSEQAALLHSMAQGVMQMENGEAGA
jgi:hypothetical protein